ncbi:hypothetical protein HanRHA438_Chr03g0139051 [Helianthus annuus]|nr:hypothetical protein HanRHA438_Chr03g0139051 [Helianthus annuus]
MFVYVKVCSSIDVINCTPDFSLKGIISFTGTQNRSRILVSVESFRSSGVFCTDCHVRDLFGGLVHIPRVVLLSAYSESCLVI